MGPAETKTSVSQVAKYQENMVDDVSDPGQVHVTRFRQLKTDMVRHCLGGIIAPPARCNSLIFYLKFKSASYRQNNGSNGSNGSNNLQ